MKKVFNFLLGIFVFLSATAYMPGHNFGEIQGHVFKIGIATLFIFSLYLKPVRHLSNFWVNCIAGLALVTTLFQPVDAKVMAVEGLVYVLLGVILLYVLMNHLDDFTPILNAICAVVLLNVMMILFQVNNMDPICIGDTGQKNNHMVGLFGFKYVFGAYMGLVAPFLLFMKRKVFGILALILTICSMSWAAVGCCFLSIIFGAWIFNRRLGIIMVAVMAVLWTASYYTLLNKSIGQTLYYKAHSRVYLQSKYLPALFAKPLIGYGLSTFKVIGPNIYYEKKYGAMEDAWNDYLERAMECGVVMTIFIVMLFWDTLKRFLKSKRSMTLIACSAALLTIPTGMALHDYFNHFSLTTMMIIIFAILEIKLKEEEDVNKICGQ